MRKLLFGMSLVVALCAPAQSQAVPAAKKESEAVPLYRLYFHRGQPIGVGTSRIPTAPSECIGDGTVFFNVLLSASGGEMPLPEPGPPIELLASVSPSGESHDFRLDQVTDLYDVHQKGHYASDSTVALLVIASPEDKRGKEIFTTSDGARHEFTENLAEQHDYLLLFDRKGHYQKKVQIEGSFAIHRVAAFSSGAFLAIGFDKQDRSPRLAIFKDDGTLSRLLEIPKGDAPKSMLGTQDARGRGPAVFIAPSELAPYGDSVIVVQDKTDFPLLEVNEAGAIREIRPRLLEGLRVESLIPSDGNLYARVNDSGAPIYELDEETGTPLKRFMTGATDSGSDVACVHDGKFLSFEYSEGKLTPLTGIAEPAPDLIKNLPQDPAPQRQ